MVVQERQMKTYRGDAVNFVVKFRPLRLKKGGTVGIMSISVLSVCAHSHATPREWHSSFVVFMVIRLIATSAHFSHGPNTRGSQLPPIMIRRAARAGGRPFGLEEHEGGKARSVVEERQARKNRGNAVSFWRKVESALV